MKRRHFFGAVGVGLIGLTWPWRRKSRTKPTVTVDLSITRASRYVGFLFRHNPGVTPQQHREYVRPFWPSSWWPCRVRMPCGQEIQCDDLDSIPLYDVPCPCGNPTHWFVKWEVVPKSPVPTPAP